MSADGEITLEFAANCVAEIAAQLIGCQHEPGESGAARRMLLANRLVRKAEDCVKLTAPTPPPEVANAIDQDFASKLIQGWVDKVYQNAALSNDEVRERLHLDEGDLFMVHDGKAVRVGGHLKPEQLTAEELRRLSELAAKDAEANSAARKKYQRTRHSAASVINDSPMVVDGLELPVVSSPTGAGNVFIRSGLESDWVAAVGCDPQPEQEIGFGPYP